MTILLNRKKIFFIGVLIIIVYLFLNRFDYIMGSTITTGKVVGFEINGGFLYPVVEFSADGKTMRLKGEEDLGLEQDEAVKVIHKTSNPENARIYNFIGFWLSPVIYSLFPVIILMSVVFSFLTKQQQLLIHFGKKMSISKVEHSPESPSEKNPSSRPRLPTKKE